MKRGDIVYCKDNLGRRTNRCYVCLSVSKNNIKVLPITKNGKVWDYSKLPIQIKEISNFKVYPSFVVLNLLEFGCLECTSSSFNSKATLDLLNKLKALGF